MTTITDSQTLGALIRNERKRQKVTQVELASLAGVGVRFLRELEKGKDSCQLGLVLCVLSTLGVSVNAATREQ
ncbi:MAG: y4mF family transcriptional regulator [Granulosicoccus sp.]|jgi:y4mF family transcriptional regulator